VKHIATGKATGRNRTVTNAPTAAQKAGENPQPKN